MADKVQSLPQVYTDAVQVIKKAILDSQYKTARMANGEQLSLYFGIGRYVSVNSRKGTWGTSAIAHISGQLKKELPGLRGFSETSIKLMRQFYESWAVLLNRQPSAGEIETSKSPATADDLQTVTINTQTLNGLDVIPGTDGLSYAEFLGISFSHHMEIIGKTDSLDERVFYIHQTFQNKWDKYTLRDMLKADLFHHQGQIPNNFSLTLSDPAQRLKAIEMFKDEYLLDYINVEELGARDGSAIDEKLVENSIVQNIKNFIMTFGRDFTYVGNQYNVEAFDHDHIIDLLFFNRELACLVAVELKSGAFKSIYLGQLNTYLRLLDDTMRKPHENPSIGIILCRDANRSYVEYVIQDYNKPMGVATYKTMADMSEEMRNALPDIEELKKLL